MLRLTTISLFLAALLAKAHAYDGLTMEDLPEHISSQLKYLLQSAIKKLEPNCTIPQPHNVKFLLYTRDVPDLPTILDPTNPSQINPKKKIVVIVHGWLSKPSFSRIIQMKNAYLKRYDANIIVVDWSETAHQLYEVVYCGVTEVAHLISDFFCRLSGQFNLHLSSIHLIGHSMGGQISGHAGKQVVDKCGMKIGRITGLDPSGPLFEYRPADERLDESDADFVDVIHTSGFSLGYYLRCGHVDFHPNCRFYPQPGCMSSANIKNESLVTDVLCAEDRALELMTESVNSDQLIAVSCSMCPRYCSHDIITEIYQVMGEDCRAIPKPAKNFFIPTNDKYPYGQGWAAYPKINQLRLEEWKGFERTLH